MRQQSSCNVCGEPYTPTGSRQKRCPACREKKLLKERPRPNCRACGAPAERGERGWRLTCGSEPCKAAVTASYKKRQESERTCKSCGQSYVATGARQEHCLTCVPDVASQTLMARYGVTYPELQAMREKQGNHCALCPRPITAVDHDHITGRLRGLVCNRCNLWLAALDDEDWLQRALAYVRQPLEQAVPRTELDRRGGPPPSSACNDPSVEIHGIRSSTSGPSCSER